MHRYLSLIPVCPESVADIRQYFEETNAFIRTHREALSDGQSVLVHCSAGVSRRWACGRACVTVHASKRGAFSHPPPSAAAQLDPGHRLPRGRRGNVASESLPRHASGAPHHRTKRRILCPIDRVRGGRAWCRRSVDYPRRDFLRFILARRDEPLVAWPAGQRRWLADVFCRGARAWLVLYLDNVMVAVIVVAMVAVTAGSRCRYIGTILGTGQDQFHD